MLVSGGVAGRRTTLPKTCLSGLYSWRAWYFRVRLFKSKLLFQHPWTLFQNTWLRGTSYFLCRCKTKHHETRLSYYSIEKTFRKLHQRRKLFEFAVFPASIQVNEQTDFPFTRLKTNISPEYWWLSSMKYPFKISKRSLFKGTFVLFHGGMF